MNASIYIPESDNGNNVKSIYDIYLPEEALSQLQERVLDQLEEVDGMTDISEIGDVKEITDAIDAASRMMFGSGLRPFIPGTIGFKRYILDKIPSSVDIDLNINGGIPLRDGARYQWEMFNRVHSNRWMISDKSPAFTYAGDGRAWTSSCLYYLPSVSNIPKSIRELAKRDKSIANRTITFPLMIIKKMQDRSISSGPLSIYVTPYTIAEISSVGYSESKEIYGKEYRLWEYNIIGLAGGSTMIMNELNDRGKFDPIAYEFTKGSVVILGTFNKFTGDESSNREDDDFRIRSKISSAQEVACIYSHNEGSRVYIYIPSDVDGADINWMSTGTSVISLMAGESFPLYTRNLHNERIASRTDHKNSSSMEEYNKRLEERTKRIASVLEYSKQHFEYVARDIHSMDINPRNKTITEKGIYGRITKNSAVFSTIGGIRYGDVQDASIIVIYLSLQYNPFNILKMLQESNISIGDLKSELSRTKFTSSQLFDYFGISIRLDAS